MYTNILKTKYGSNMHFYASHLIIARFWESCRKPKAVASSRRILQKENYVWSLLLHEINHNATKITETSVHYFRPHFHYLVNSYMHYAFLQKKYSFQAMVSYKVYYYCIQVVNGYLQLQTCAFFCMECCPESCIWKAAKRVIISARIVLLVHGLVFIKTYLLIACTTAIHIYAIIQFWICTQFCP